MGTKAWYSDPSVVKGILTALLGLYMAIRLAVPALPDIPNADVVVGSIIVILGATGIFGRMTDKSKPKLGLKTRR